MINKLLVILILAVAIRIILAMSSYHIDLRTFQYAGEVIAKGHILDLYDYVLNLPDSQIIKKFVIFNYPPAIYFFYGIFNFLYSIIFGQDFINQYLIVYLSDFGKFSLNIHLLLIKLPYLVFDLLTAFLLAKVFTSAKDKFRAITFWMFNPFNLYTTYMVGQFDIIPTFFTVLSIVFAVKKKLGFAALALGFGAAFKIYPLFLLTPLVFLEKRFVRKVGLLLLGVSPYLLSILPYIYSHGFKATALFAVQSDKSLYTSINLSGNEKLLLFPLFLIIYYLHLWYRTKYQNPFNLWESYLIILLLFFIFTHTHPQWFVWLTPFLIIYQISYKFKKSLPIAILLFCYLGQIFLFDNSLTFGLLSPIFPTFLYYDVHFSVNYDLTRSLLQSVFAASAFYIIGLYLYYKKE